MKKLALALALGLLGLLAMPAMAQDKTVDLKISIWLPPAHPLVPASKEWAKSIDEGLGRHHQERRSSRPSSSARRSTTTTWRATASPT